MRAVPSLIFLLLSFVAAVRAQEPGGFVNFNFEQVEIPHLVTVVGAQTGRRFVLDGDIKGRVSVITREHIPVSEVFPLFVAVLEGAGYTVVERDGAYHVRVLGGDDPLQAPVVGAEEPLQGVGLVTRVLRLKHIRASDVRPILEPMVRRAKEGALTAFTPTNHLVITDTASNLARIEALLAELDLPGQSTHLTVIPLQHASARELADQIRTALLGAESAGSQVSRHVQGVIAGRADLPPDFTLVAAEQANALIASAGPLQLQQIREMVAQLDVPAASAAAGRLRAVFLNYVSSEAAAKQLSALLARRKDREMIAVEADVPNNAVLVDAGPLDFAAVKSLLEELDRPPQQVMVEVMILEVAGNDSLNLGAELATIDAPREGSTTVAGRSRPGDTDTIMGLVQEQTFPQGMSFGLIRGDLSRIPLLIEALAGERDVNILSHVPLRTQNNAEASVSVVENIPILKSIIEGGTGDNRDVIQNIERLDVGIKLTVRPQVNPNREITLQLHPSIEAIIQETAAGVALTPTIARREVKSTLTLPDRTTVVISGLLRENRVKEEKRVPILGRIPILGFLFRKTSERREKTNLLIFVTPRIVTDVAENAEADQRWIDRTGLEPTP